MDSFKDENIKNLSPLKPKDLRQKVDVFTLKESIFNDERKEKRKKIILTLIFFFILIIVVLNI